MARPIPDGDPMQNKIPDTAEFSGQLSSEAYFYRSGEKYWVFGRDYALTAPTSNQKEEILTYIAGMESNAANVDAERRAAAHAALAVMEEVPLKALVSGMREIRTWADETDRIDLPSMNESVRQATITAAEKMATNVEETLDNAVNASYGTRDSRAIDAISRGRADLERGRSRVEAMKSEHARLTEEERVKTIADRDERTMDDMRRALETANDRLRLIREIEIPDGTSLADADLKYTQAETHEGEITSAAQAAEATATRLKTTSVATEAAAAAKSIREAANAATEALRVLNAGVESIPTPEAEAARVRGIEGQTDTAEATLARNIRAHANAVAAMGRATDATRLLTDALDDEYTDPDETLYGDSLREQARYQKDRLLAKTNRAVEDSRRALGRRWREGTGGEAAKREAAKREAAAARQHLAEVRAQSEAAVAGLEGIDLTGLPGRLVHRISVVRTGAANALAEEHDRIAAIETVNTALAVRPGWFANMGPHARRATMGIAALYAASLAYRLGRGTWTFGRGLVGAAWGAVKMPFAMTYGAASGAASGWRAADSTLSGTALAALIGAGAAGLVSGGEAFGISMQPPNEAPNAVEIATMSTGTLTDEQLTEIRAAADSEEAAQLAGSYLHGAGVDDVDAYFRSRGLTTDSSWWERLRFGGGLVEAGSGASQFIAAPITATGVPWLVGGVASAAKGGLSGGGLAGALTATSAWFGGGRPIELSDLKNLRNAGNELRPSYQAARRRLTGKLGPDAGLAARMWTWARALPHADSARVEELVAAIASARNSGVATQFLAPWIAYEASEAVSPTARPITYPHMAASIDEWTSPDNIEDFIARVDVMAFVRQFETALDPNVDPNNPMVRRYLLRDLRNFFGENATLRMIEMRAAQIKASGLIDTLDNRTEFQANAMGSAIQALCDIATSHEFHGRAAAA